MIADYFPAVVALSLGAFAAVLIFVSIEDALKR
jgi:hypothetical protein